MRERLFFTCKNDEQKKTILDALKNEQKYNKKIGIYDSNNEEITKIIKWDVYTDYIDFWLDNFIGDFMLKNRGRIDKIQLYDFENTKGQIITRIEKITV